MPKGSPSATTSDAATTRHQVGEVRRVHRSELKGADYNPRKLSPAARRRLEENIARIGAIGPFLVWNPRTGNVVSGHQRLAILDALEGSEDYFLDVTALPLSERQEREQNVFFNSPDAQGEFDEELLGELLADDDVDWERAGLDRMTIEAMFEDSDLLDTLFGAEEAPAVTATKDEAQRLKDIARVKGGDGYADRKQAERAENESYVCLVFASDDEVRAFLERIGEPPDAQYVDGRAALKALEATTEG